MDGCLIPLGRKGFAIVDSEDYERAMQYSWVMVPKRRRLYARREWRIGNRLRRYEYLHSFIMRSREQIDHRNLDGLDCRKANLRFATAQQNAANKERRPGGSSKYKGVYWSKSINRWVARLRTKHLCSSTNEEDAARAYDEAALKMYGEFARTNGFV